MIRWIDAHNHLHDRRIPETEKTIAEMKAAGVIRCVVNATREADWQHVEKLHHSHPDFILPAFGIHPWHAHTAESGWQDRLLRLLEKIPSSTLGECGVDGWVGSPALDLQVPVFEDQLRIARDLGRTVTIHALKAWQPLFDAFEKTPPPPRFLMHSFGGSLEIAQRLIPLGAWFSFSGYFLHPRKRKALETWLKLPAGRLLLETDAPDMPPPQDKRFRFLEEQANHPVNLPAIATVLAEKMDISPIELSRLTLRNFSRCFPVR